MQRTMKRLETLYHKITPYLFILPYILFFLTFVLTPVIMSFVVSFLDWDYTSPATFVGFDNFKLIFNLESLTGSKFWEAVSHTLLFVAIQAPILIIIPFLIAVLLNSKYKGSRLTRTIVYFPAILPIATVAIIFFVLLDTNVGMINKLLGVEIPWLTKQPEQWISIFLLSTWWGLGGNMMLFTAGMQNVSKDIYEAAAIDGCNKWQSMIHITIPSLKDTFVYVIVMTILSCFNVMGQPMMLTAGEETTTVAMQYIYNIAFGGWRLGRASAMSLIVAGMMAIFSVLAFKVITRKTDAINE